MKGQYFSFDAIIASVIMVVAITSLTAYWFGVQSVVESKSSPMYADALRVAESLVSPGSPENWTLYAGTQAGLSQIRQIGLTKSYGGELDLAKITTLQNLSLTGNYVQAGRIMRVPGEYYIVIEQTDNPTSGKHFEIGTSSFTVNSTEVAIAHRGAVLKDENTGIMLPMRITVYLWR